MNIVSTLLGLVFVVFAIIGLLFAINVTPMDARFKLLFQALLIIGVIVAIIKTA